MSDDLYFFQYARFDGEWISATSAYRPSTKTTNGVMRIKLSEGLGPRIRTEAVTVPKDHRHLTLDQLTEVYAPDGRFRATSKRPDDVEGNATSQWVPSSVVHSIADTALAATHTEEADHADTE